MVLYAYMCVFVHSRFIENPLIWSWETNPSFLRWFYRSFELTWSKTYFLKCDVRATMQEEGDVRLNGQVVLNKDTFHYLRLMFLRDGDINKDVSHRIKSDWLKWCQASHVLCNPWVKLKPKDKFYRTAVWPAIFYVAECWLTERWHVQQLSIA
jgi:hypothetical protein